MTRTLATVTSKPLEIELWYLAQQYRFTKQYAGHLEHKLKQHGIQATVQSQRFTLSGTQKLSIHKADHSSTRGTTTTTSPTRLSPTQPDTKAHQQLEITPLQPTAQSRWISSTNPSNPHGSQLAMLCTYLAQTTYTQPANMFERFDASR